jgi:hypothetical protein
MNKNIQKKPAIKWVSALWNSLLVTILSYMVYMIPAFYVAFKMGFELGPKLQDPAEVSRQISGAIPPIYQNNQLLTIGFIMVTALLIFWRGRRIAAGTGEKSIINGVLVCTIPVLLTIMFIFSRGFQIRSLAEIVIYLITGYTAGRMAKNYLPESTPNPKS